MYVCICARRILGVRPGYEAIACTCVCVLVCWGRPGYKAIVCTCVCVRVLGEAWVRGYSMRMFVCLCSGAWVRGYSMCMFVCMYAGGGLGTRLLRVHVVLVCWGRPGYEAIYITYTRVCMCWGRPGYEAIACTCVCVCACAGGGLGTRL